MTVIQDDYLLGGQALPFLQGLDWKIITTRYTKKTMPSLLNPDEKISVRWVKDSHTSDLYVEGMNTKQLMEHLGMTFSLKKGVFVWSKRFSRIMRPFFFWDFPERLDVYHDPTLDKVENDGMGWIRRDVLLSLLKHLPENKSEKLTNQLMKSGRLELTLIGPWGEDKGHVFVVDELEHDIVLADDSKKEIFSSRVMLAVKPVKSKDYRYVDFQTMLNWHPFIREEHYKPWLEAEGDKFLDQLADGKWVDLARRLSEKQRAGWWIMEYLKRGYNVKWFQGAIKSLGNIHHVKVYARGIEQMRLPIPGAFYYIALDKHMGYNIPKGSIALDRKRATAFLSHQDWEWLRVRFGGADFDDFATLLGFTDYDGERKVLAIRSPNAVGDWAILKPFGKFPKSWTWPNLDTRDLPATPKTTYLHLIDKPEILDVEYSIAAATTAILSAAANAGEPGGSVNGLMIYKAMTGTQPDVLPATIEEIMDAVAKLGSLLTRVKEWNRSFMSEFILKNPKVPKSMIRRVWGLLSDEAKEALESTDDHWVESLKRMVLTHLESYDRKLDEIAKTAMPPLSVLEYGREYTEQAGKIRMAFTDALTAHSGVKDEVAWNAIKAAVEKEFWKYPTDQWTKIMAGIAVRVYVMSDTPSSDALMWQIGQSILDDRGLAAKDLQGIPLKRRRGIVNVTMKMLEEVKPEDKPVIPVIGRGAWFSVWNALRRQQGQPESKHMGEVPKLKRDELKAKVSEWADAGRFNDLLQVKYEEEGGELRAKVYRNGTLLMYVQRGQEGRIGETFKPLFAKAQDGNLYMVVEEKPDAE